MDDDGDKTPVKPTKAQEKKRLEALQTALVDAQIYTAANGKRLCVLLEGRDTAGKDGAIKRITEYLSVRQTRVIALPKPSDKEKGEWWFQRYIQHLPTSGEWVLFNRSWYNRAGVEKVMGFSTTEEQEAFIRDVPEFEAMLSRSGIILVKLWLDISREEQKKRLKARKTDPLKRLKVSALDAVAQEKWDEYSVARDEMLKRSHRPETPWICVVTDSKPQARENIIRHILQVIGCPDHKTQPEKPDSNILFSFDDVISGEKSLMR